MLLQAAGQAGELEGVHTHRQHEANLGLKIPGWPRRHRGKSTSEQSLMAVLLLHGSGIRMPVQGSLQAAHWAVILWRPDGFSTRCIRRNTFRVKPSFGRQGLLRNCYPSAADLSLNINLLSICLLHGRETTITVKVHAGFNRRWGTPKIFFGILNANIAALEATRSSNLRSSSSSENSCFSRQ